LVLDKVSVIIPSRNEFLLKRTIDSTLKASRGDIEIIAICDGYWPDPSIDDDDRVTLIHHSEPVGQRHGVNEAAEIAKGKFILKTDAHSIFDEGFDVKLAEDCEYDWTVIPRMYNLHAFDWVCGEHRFYQDKFSPKKDNVCPDCGKPLTIEYIWKPRRHKRTDFMRFDRQLRVQYWSKYEKRPESKGDIVDVMNGQGACWFQHRDRFLELGGLDERHGSWGQVGVEVACKAWLSGGRQVVNKKTWFAHMFRTTGVFTFPYKIRGSEQEKARRYSRDLWTNDKWPLTSLVA
jgi:glycosyltransferase involved in cell wall biosynthesis